MCGGHDVRPSARRGLMDNIRKIFSQAPYRCRACQHRYYRHLLAGPDSPENDENT
jgi:hypothetical protein